MRLIDADALIDRVRKTDRYFHIKFDIEEAPAIDPESIRPKGRWLYNSTEKPMFRICNNCGMSFRIIDGEKLWNGCPNCFADMRE